MDYISFCKLDELLEGIDSFMRLELLEDTIQVEGVAYNTKNIVSLNSMVIYDRLVRKNVKDDLKPWKYKIYFKENELEPKVNKI